MADSTGKALLDIPCYKILMGCDGKNLQETKDLYNLTDAEQELLESKRHGHALFIIGSKQLHVNFEISAYKFSYMRPIIKRETTTWSIMWIFSLLFMITTGKYALEQVRQ